MEFLKEMGLERNLGGGGGLGHAVIPRGAGEIPHEDLVGEVGIRETEAGEGKACDSGMTQGHGAGRGPAG